MTLIEPPIGRSIGIDWGSDDIRESIVFIGRHCLRSLELSIDVPVFYQCSMSF